MRRIMFEKTGNAVWISHLDLMRLFQRAFKRAGLPLKHTQGFTPRPSVSIALPLSVGVQSHCELLDFELDTSEIVSDSQIVSRLNKALTDGIKVLDCYENGGKLRDLAYLRAQIIMEYDKSMGCAGAAIKALLSSESVIVQKKSKNGTTEQNIIPMILSCDADTSDDQTLILDVVVCCQNPSLNPMQIVEAVRTHLPEYAPAFARCSRISLYDRQQAIFK